MARVSQAAYARSRGITRRAVRKRTIGQGGPLPTYGPRRQIDEAEADALYEATMAPNGAATSRYRAPAAEAPAASPAPDSPVLESASQLVQSRTAMLATELELKRLELEQRRGESLRRAPTLDKLFAFSRLLRDSWQAWPARVGPQLAADFDLDATAVTVALEGYVREQLEQLSRERLEL